MGPFTRRGGRTTNVVEVGAHSRISNAYNTNGAGASASLSAANPNATSNAYA